jgi:uncharacterized repeat protein (TIGR03803 family)
MRAFSYRAATATSTARASLRFTPHASAEPSSRSHRRAPLPTFSILIGQRDRPFTPRSGLTLGVDGNYYGTTSSGGTFNFGTVFKFTGGGTMTTLYVWHGQISQGRRLPPLVTPSPGQGPSFVCCPGRNASDGVVGIDTSEDARFSDRSIQGLCLFRILIISVAESELVAMR